jgi:hypothetical protein
VSFHFCLDLVDISKLGLPPAAVVLSDLVGFLLCCLYSPSLSDVPLIKALTENYLWVSAHAFEASRFVVLFIIHILPQSKSAYRPIIQESLRRLNLELPVYPKQKHTLCGLE